MAVGKRKFAFTGTLARIKTGFINTAIFLPDEVIKMLPDGRVRVKGTINGAPFSLAVLHSKGGGRFFSVGAPLRKAAGIKLNDPVNVAFALVDPDVLEIPEELEAVLAQDNEGMDAWQKLTTGYQRSLIHYITAVKNIDSRIKRSLQLVERAKAGLLPGAKNRE